MKKALLVYELLNRNYFLEKQGIEISREEFDILKEFSPDQVWIVFAPVRPDQVPNNGFDWESYNKYQEEFETSLRNKCKQTSQDNGNN